MQFDFTEISRERRYKLLNASIVPRPIAWVSSLDADGRLNAAPFSSFNVFGEDPPTVGFSILHRSATDIKDTGANIRARGEFVVNLVSDETLEAMVISAIDFGPEVDEFAEANLAPLPSLRVATPRIGESRISFECRLRQIIPIGGMRSLVLGEVLMMHVPDQAVIDAERSWIDTKSLRLVGRMGPNQYVRTTDIVEREVPAAGTRRQPAAAGRE
jgi:flavin reductase (DIM6/NTAB) family NADH-FMN oxidoreductase RutF